MRSTREVALALALLCARPALAAALPAAPAASTEVCPLPPPAPLRASPAEALRLRRAEADLLHRRVDLKGLRRWNGTAEWPAAMPQPGVLLVVHVWATTCKPCLRELPVLLRAMDAFVDTAEVRFALVSEDDPETLATCLGARPALQPRSSAVIHYLNGGIQLRASLQNQMQPLTLLLDQDLVVRQALAGSLLERRAELVRSIEAFLRGPDREHARGQPPPALGGEARQRALEAGLLHLKLDAPMPEAPLRVLYRSGAPAEVALLEQIAGAFPRRRVRFLATAAALATDTEVLLLDRRGMVRQAFLGPLRGRRGELVTGIERLARVQGVSTR